MLLKLLLLSAAALFVRGLKDVEEKEPLPTVARLQRDALLDAPVQELLLAPLDDRDGLDARLQRAFVQCRELGVTSFMYEMDAESLLDADDEAYCNQLRYVRHQRQRFRDAHKELETTESSDEQVERKAVDDVSFQEFFELYAEKTRPVVLQLKEDVKDPVAQLLGLVTSNDVEEDTSTMDKFLSGCFAGEANQDDRIQTHQLRVENEACAALLEATFRVPIYMTHDYVQRTNASREEAFLPAIIDLPSASSSEAPPNAKEIVACPYGLHMLAIPIGPGAVTLPSLPRSHLLRLLRSRSICAPRLPSMQNTTIDNESIATETTLLETSESLSDGGDKRRSKWCHPRGQMYLL